MFQALFFKSNLVYAKWGFHMCHLTSLYCWTLLRYTIRMSSSKLPKNTDLQRAKKTVQKWGLDARRRNKVKAVDELKNIYRLLEFLDKTGELTDYDRTLSNPLVRNSLNLK